MVQIHVQIHYIEIIAYYRTQFLALNWILELTHERAHTY
jgi:hypothetical protein